MIKRRKRKFVCTRKEGIARGAVRELNLQSIRTDILAVSAGIMKKSLLRRKRKERINKYILSLLASSFTVLVSVLLSYVSGIPLYVFVPPVFIVVFFAVKKGCDNFIFILSSILFALLMENVSYFTPFLFSFIMIFAPLYVINRNVKDMHKTLRELGFNGSVFRAFFISLISLVPVALILFIISYIAVQLNIDDSSLVSSKVINLPWYVIIYAVSLAPLAEEMFFRSFLVRYMNPVLANILFAFAHFSYGSYMEIIGAFVMGMLLYIVYSKSNDLKTAIFLHAMINIGSIVTMVML